MQEIDAINWLMAANAAIWLGIGCYAAFLGAKQKRLALRLKQFEVLREEEDERA